MPERKSSSAFAPELIEEINQVAGFFDDNLRLRDLLLANEKGIWKIQAGVADPPTQWVQLMQRLPISTKGNLNRAMMIVMYEQREGNVAALRDPDSLTMLTKATKEFILASFADRREDLEVSS